jgi:peptide/nickel transport system ATP-binding protein
VVEHGFSEEVLTRPRHPYTQRLVASLPTLERPTPDVLALTPESRRSLGAPRARAVQAA